jgi:hypothetical protein
VLLVVAAQAAGAVLVQQVQPTPVAVVVEVKPPLELVELVGLV